MGILDVFLGGDYDPEDDRLAAPLMSEATDLALHVERCAGRYQQIRKSQHNQARRSTAALVLIIALLVITLLANGEKALRVLSAIL